MTRRRKQSALDIRPPWTLVIDENGKPLAIVPSGRRGTVADVRGMSMKKAKEIVRTANEWWQKNVLAFLEKRIESVRAVRAEYERFVADVERLKDKG
jgi:broad specificity phosphatase PhoE